MSRRNPLRNCLACGRDTTARDGVCARCRGGGSGPTHCDGRPARGATESDSALAATDEDEDDPRPGDGYHGFSVRDDI